ncbi:MAG: 5,10-methylenetetrahydrofolate reductase [Gammaproteobacteria bacterium]|nr:5,10-methylenetetrahydrofolate reductase [Gammaproteobacteria bacterium]MYF49384.1 5,10-methylenetetrahydrofolate reductase [Gammaproteobacteria bacterium]
MSHLSDSLALKSFTLTAELNPPKGTELDELYAAAETLKDWVAAFNLTDSAASRMAMAPLAVARLLKDRGIESTLQIAGRDRNRLAIQADMLAAHALGVENIVCMTGDPPSGGDHPDAKPVFDLGAEDILKAAVSLESGHDLADNALKGSPHFLRGAVVNVAVPDLGKEIGRMEGKIEAGAEFFQTNAVYEPAGFEGFMKRVEGFKVPILAGIIMLKSAKQARYMTEKIPGVEVPDALIDELENAESRVAASVAMAGRIVQNVAPMCQGVHIMAIGWEHRIPAVMEAAGL